MKNLVLFVKYKRPCQKTLSCPVFSYYICWIYVYLCTYVYHESARTRLKICILTFSLLSLGLTTNKSLYLYTILRFNKADLFYLQSLPVWGWYTVNTSLSHCLQTWFVDWYICMYTCITDRDDTTVLPFGCLFLERKLLCHDPLTFYSFSPSSIWKWHAILMYYIDGI